MVELLNILYFILCCYGLTQLLVYGTIFDKIRPKGKLWHCTMCMGFWVGGLLFLLNRWTSLFTFEYEIFNFFLLGFLSSGTSYILSTIFDDLGIRINK